MTLRTRKPRSSSEVVQLQHGMQNNNSRFPGTGCNGRAEQTGRRARQEADSRGALREPTPHFLMATQIFASSSDVLSTKKRWFADRL